jgi:hypothetical protein
MIGSANPNRSARLQDTPALANPFFVKRNIVSKTAAFIPLSFVDFYHFTCLTSNTVIRQHIRRVGEDHIGKIICKRPHYIKTIAEI